MSHKCNEELVVSNIYIVIPSKLAKKHQITSANNLKITITHSCCQLESEIYSLNYICNWQIAYRHQKQSLYDPDLPQKDPIYNCQIWRTNFATTYKLGERVTFNLFD